MKKIDENYFIKTKEVNFDPKIEDIIDEDEKILWRGKPYRKSFILSSFFRMFFFAIIWLAFDTFAIVMIVSTGIKEWWFILIMVIFFAFHLLPVWAWISNIVTASKRQKREEYAFTERRIIIKSGIISSNIQSINYSSIDSINMKVGLIERACKVADIYIVYNNKKAILEDLSDPYFIYHKLQKIANDIKADIIYPNALRKEENTGYKTNYNHNDDLKIKK